MPFSLNTVKVFNQSREDGLGVPTRVCAAISYTRALSGTTIVAGNLIIVNSGRQHAILIAIDSKILRHVVIAIASQF